MKATDLRLGNYIIDDVGRIVEVTHLTLNCIEAKPVNDSGIKWTTVFRADVVPLTKEWLIRFGFQKFDCYDFGISLKLVPRYENNDFSILLSGGEFWYTTRQYDGGSNDPFEPVIQVNSVHQLQNIFYCLTGQELTLAPPQR